MERNDGLWAHMNDPWQRVLDEGLLKVLPKRKKGEDKKKFRTRCMGSKAMKREFPDRKQRFAVCQVQAEKIE